ncbi:class III poly(R)-hydroxyalkanoic acid synthase subunit PhaC [Serpentinicella alkaliphila]|nr:class III poly(R)-hydroxyalkanoic acid synthase subunit PhaC [Serpentinicella alkaliphila]
MKLLTQTSIFEAMSKVLQKQQKLIDGIDVLMNIEYEDHDKTPKELVYQEDKMKLYRYISTTKPKTKIPTLVVYALMNRSYIMDIQRDKSFIKKLLDEGLDLYIVDWGYPTAEDRYITMEDYIEGYLGNAIDYIRKTHNLDKINIISKCQGGTFCTIYSALYPEKIKNLVTIAAPFDFSTDDGLLFKWAKDMNVDGLVDAYGIVPGTFLNSCFVSLKPYSLLVDKYIGLIDGLDDKNFLSDFLGMEKWLFDSPGQAGEAYRKYMKDLWQDNKLIKGEFTLGGKKVDLKNVTMPLLNVVGDKDNLIVPAASKPLNDAVGSKDKELVTYPVGHAGIVASSRSQKEIAPKVAKWLLDRSK